MKLYRPVNQAELDLIIAKDWKKFPPRLVGQPIFYPVLNARYAQDINRQWNVPSYGTSYTLTFEVNDDYLKQYEVEKVGLDYHLEFWIPSGDLENFNDNIVGRIKIFETFEKN